MKMNCALKKGRKEKKNPEKSWCKRRENAVSFHLLRLFSEEVTLYPVFTYRVSVIRVFVELTCTLSVVLSIFSHSNLAIRLKLPADVQTVARFYLTEEEEEESGKHPPFRKNTHTQK
jgi:hypothetical protein